MIIIGAGLSGCIAGLLNPGALILEASSGASEHQAVLRFRSPQIGTALGIPFKEVTVHKNVYVDRRNYSHATIAEMNTYARKVTGQIGARSIADLRPVQRWIAPANLHAQLMTRLGERLRLEDPVTLLTVSALHTKNLTIIQRTGRPVISTMPMARLAQLLYIEIATNFSFAPIHVTRWRIPDCDVHQTIYFPSPNTAIYRATLTGEHLIVEAMNGEDAPDAVWQQVVEAFGLSGVAPEFIGHKMQRYGKIVPIDPELRKRTLYQITRDFNIYSLGRFALWSNILLDDVYDDLAKIRNMISLTNGYDLLRSHV